MKKTNTQKKRPQKNVAKKRRKIVLKKSTRPTGLVEVADVLLKINYVQVERQPAKFNVSFEDAPTVENILKDAGLVVMRTDTANHVVYQVDPGEQTVEGTTALEGLDELSDEITEDGQIFD